jgi:hypothetical protein
VFCRRQMPRVFPIVGNVELVVVHIAHLLNAPKEKKQRQKREELLSVGEQIPT